MSSPPAVDTINCCTVVLRDPSVQEKERDEIGVSGREVIEEEGM